MNSTTATTRPKVVTAKHAPAADDERLHESRSSKDVNEDNLLRKIEGNESAEEKLALQKKNDDSDKTKKNYKDNEKDDDDEMMDIRVPSGMILLEGDENDGNILTKCMRPTATAPQKPTENLKVDDRAIMDCWDLNVASHDAAAVVSDATSAIGIATVPSPSKQNDYRWHATDTTGFPAAAAEAKDTDLLQHWQPKPMALPAWAVDPFEMGFIIDRVKRSNEEREMNHKRSKW